MSAIAIIPMIIVSIVINSYNFSQTLRYTRHAVKKMITMATKNRSCIEFSRLDVLNV